MKITKYEILSFAKREYQNDFSEFKMERSKVSRKKQMLPVLFSRKLLPLQ